MKIKVCGLKVNESSHRIANMEGVDMLGFIFYPNSKRYTTETITSRGKERVGVFVNAQLREIEAAIYEHSLTMVQLHGDESPAFCMLIAETVKIIKAFGIENRSDLAVLDDYHGSVDFFLFDTKSSEYGGTGRGFDWSILNDYTGATPFLISGGIGLDSLGELKKFRHPQLAGVDLNSKFETEPGVKNPSFINAFIRSYRS